MLLKPEIFEEFFRDSNAGLTGSFIARKKHLNQKSVSNYLNLLEKETILQSKTQGKNKLYHLNMHELTKQFIMAIEHLRTMKFYKKHAVIKEIAEKMQPFVKGSAIIFGSYVKGIQKKDSDLDILIIGKCNEKEIEKISKMYRIDISLKIYPRLAKDILMKEVIKDHILMKNAQAFVDGIYI